MASSGSSSASKVAVVVDKLISRLKDMIKRLKTGLNARPRSISGQGQQNFRVSYPVFFVALFSVGYLPQLRKDT